jgi:hypothetical protein
MGVGRARAGAAEPSCSAPGDSEPPSWRSAGADKRLCGRACICTCACVRTRVLRLGHNKSPEHGLLELSGQLGRGRHRQGFHRAVAEGARQVVMISRRGACVSSLGSLREPKVALPRFSDVLQTTLPRTPASSGRRERGRRMRDQILRGCSCRCCRGPLPVPSPPLLLVRVVRRVVAVHPHLDLLYLKRPRGHHVRRVPGVGEPAMNCVASRRIV